MAEPAKKTAEEEAKQDEKLEEGVTEEKLVDTVQENLSKLFGDLPDDEEEGKDKDTDGDEQAEEDEDVDDSTPEDNDETKEDDDKQAEEDDEDDDSTPDGEEEGKKKSGSEEEVTLDEAYYRAAVHQGWKPEDIKEFFEATPEQAIKTFAKIHETTNKLTSEFARIGRMEPVKEKEVAVKADDAVDENAAEIAALKEQYGEDSAVVKIVLAQQKTINKLVAQPKPESKQQEAEELDPVIRKRIEKFFVDPALKPYSDFYGEGNDEAKLTRGQSEKRYEMLITADSIVFGYQKQGREITLEEALEKAHLLVSEPERENALRSELHAKVKRRAKGVSLKPAKSKKVIKAKDAANMTEKDREAKVAANLSKIFR